MQTFFQPNSLIRAHLGGYIKVLKLPEFSLIKDVSEKKVTIYFLLLLSNVFEHMTELFMSW